jgi:hypothetical protein
MMKMKKMLSAILALAIVLLSACGDDDKPAAPKAKFDFNDNTVSLTDANLYLMYENTDGSGHIFRDYFITDGVYDEGNGWSMNSYTGATYLIAVEVGVPVAEEVLTPGEYPLYYSFSTAPENSNIGWFMFDSEAFYYETPNEILDGDPIEISGAFDDGDTMTIKFNGTLEFYPDGPSEEVSGKFYYKGEVQDVRSVLAKAIRGGAK